MIHHHPEIDADGLPTERHRVTVDPDSVDWSDWRERVAIVGTFGTGFGLLAGYLIWLVSHPWAWLLAWGCIVCVCVLVLEDVDDD